ncbi:helix-turn-helix domain-containing protein [Streptacidiphilus monticola]
MSSQSPDPHDPDPYRPEQHNPERHRPERQSPGPHGPGPHSPDLRLLRLLAEGASAEELTEAGGGEAGRLALQVHRTLAQHRRREAQLSALFETATDLAASRDLDTVLQAIVRRARQLLGTDTAYLTLPDPEAGDTYMRTTDGSVSPLFQSLRLELGHGLGGLVAQTAQPYATSDYRTDTRFHHTRNIDAGVGDEGLVAILGVPLLLEKKVIGVLFAADRSPRPFAPDEVALLCAFAAHAAVALDTRSAMAELAEANAVIREHAEAMQRAERAHDRLTDLVLRGGDVADVADAVSRLLGGPVSVVEEPAEPALAEALTESRTSGRAVLHEGAWVCAVMAGQQQLGALVLTNRPLLGDADRRLFERASIVTALLLLLRRSVAEAENRVRGELLSDLLAAPDRDPAGLVQRGLRLGVDLRKPHVLLAASAADAPRGRLAHAATQFLFGRGGVSAEQGEEVALLLPAADLPEVTARQAAAQLGALLGVPVTVGGAGPASGPAALATAYAEALRCAKALVALDRAGEGASASGLGFLGVLLGDARDVSGFVRATLGPLLEYDTQRGTELVRTLHAYFASGASLTRAKDDLHVHVNTVVQRLDRIGALLGRDWNQPERALELQLAVKLHFLAAD